MLFMPKEDAKKLAESYLTKYRPHAVLQNYLGGGTDGHVWETDQETAVKVLISERGYFKERNSYLRLNECGIQDRIAGFWLPELIWYSDEFRAVEMAMMHKAPYVIDFAKCRIDDPPDFSEEVIAEFHAKGQEEFGPHWPKVQVLLKKFEELGIYYTDAKPDNIKVN